MTKRQIVPTRRRVRKSWFLLLLLPLLFHNVSCTMFLIKEGVKEVKKLEEERKEKKEQQQRQWQNEQLPGPSRMDEESSRPYHHGRWTPNREE
ncbi:MAG: hypothetical protein JXA11_12105 [Phycisphaerae bacterium]|nr:hypothetical protein [Phycisphaerae bacterium]